MSERTCTMPECHKPHLARGLCSTHYNQQITDPVARYPVTTVKCEWCGVEIIKRVDPRRPRRYCGYGCRTAHRAATPDYQRPASPRPLKVKPTVQLPFELDSRSDLRYAYEERDWAGVIGAVRRDVVVDDNGCWNWQRWIKKGYSVVLLGKRYFYVHRLVVEAKHRGLLGDQPVHHECANTICVNPDHLKPVTHRENVAEMLSRTYMERRIRDLESALTTVDPDHPLLAQIGIPASA